MKKIDSNWFYLLFAILFILMLTNSCKKDEISKKDSLITWINPDNISFGTLLSATQLNATSDVEGTFVYTPAIGTLLDIGKQDLEVYFTPLDADTYNNASKTVEIYVTNDPLITWENPANIIFGTLLSTTQLNATAAVPGTFIYTPAIGALLIEGANQDLKVDFTPLDAATYISSSKTVNINVISNTVSDVDGNIYNAITIGTQIWLVENLKTTHYNDGTPIPHITDNTAWEALITPAYCWYNNDASTYKATYGALYNWYTVDSASNGNKNICPVGWHVPIDNEWTTLENYLISNGYNYDGTNTNNKIAKSLAAATNWLSATAEGSPGNTDYPLFRNKSGFTALPGGTRYSIGTFDNNSKLGYWWSATESNFSAAFNRAIYFNNSKVEKSMTGFVSGYSIRCIGD